MELSESGGVLSADQVASVSITCYNLKEEDVEYSSDGSRSVVYSPDKEVRRTYTDPEQLEQLLAALYPGELTDAAGGNITGRLWSDNYEVSVVFRPEERFSENYPYFTVLEDRLPDFIIEEMKSGE